MNPHLINIHFMCEKCGQHLSVEPAAGGLTVPCPTCGETLTVPLPGSTPVLSAEASTEGRTETSITLGTMTKPCPSCAEAIPKNARICLFCGYDLIARLPASAVAEKALPPGIVDRREKAPPKTTGSFLNIVSFMGVVILLGSVYLCYGLWREYEITSFLAAAEPVMDQIHQIKTVLGKESPYFLYNDEVTKLSLKVKDLSKVKQDKETTKTLDERAKQLYTNINLIHQIYCDAGLLWAADMKCSSDPDGKIRQKLWGDASTVITEVDQSYENVKNSFIRQLYQWIARS